MAYLDDYDLALNEEFRKKVKIGMLKIASAVCGEAPGATDALTVKRNNTTTFVIYNQANALNIISYLIASLGTLDVDSTDEHIFNAISAVWNDLSGVLYSETQTT